MDGSSAMSYFSILVFSLGLLVQSVAVARGARCGVRRVR